MGLGNDEDVGVDDIDGGDCGGTGGGKSFDGSVSCSICLEVVTDNGDRSCAKLQCGHQFHLDCIGSAFNIKGAMQCPNCRKIDKGQWLYANGSCSFPEFNMDDWTHDEDLYDLNYSEMSFGVHWCPFGSFTRLPSSFDEGEYSSTAYHNILGQHALFAEHAAVSSATHPCPYIAYLGPIHPSSSNSTGSLSEASSFNGHWNGTSIPNELQTSYAFPAMDLHYHSWEPHLPPFSTAGSHIGGTDQPSIPLVTQRPSRASSDMSRSMNPFFVGHSHGSGARAGDASLVTSSMIPPYPGSNARARDRVQALQAYYQQQHSSNSPSMRSPIISASRRSSNHRGLPQFGTVASSDQSGGFYIFPPGTSDPNFQNAESPLSSQFNSWDRDHLPAFSSNQVDRDLSWGAFHQVANGLDATFRSSSFRQRHGAERSSQNR